MRSSPAFTFVEVLFLLAVVAIAGAGVTSATVGAWRRLEVSRTEAEAIANLQQLEYGFRKAISGIRPPYWFPEPEISESGGAYSVMQAGPGSEAMVTIRLSVGAVVLDQGGSLVRFSVGADRLELTSVIADGRPIGARLSLGFDGETVNIVEAYGAISM